MENWEGSEKGKKGGGGVERESVGLWSCLMINSLRLAPCIVAYITYNYVKLRIFLSMHV